MRTWHNSGPESLQGGCSCRESVRAVRDDAGETGRDQLLGEKNKRKMVVARQEGVTV